MDERGNFVVNTFSIIFLVSCLVALILLMLLQLQLLPQHDDVVVFFLNIDEQHYVYQHYLIKTKTMTRTKVKIVKMEMKKMK